MSPVTQAPPDALLTAKQFFALPDNGRILELVRGRIVEMPPTGFRHGLVCANIAALLWDYVRSRQLGRVVSNDAGIVTEHDPDTVRGPDIAYFSYATLPREHTPTGYPDVVPDLVFEVRSPSNRRKAMHAKAGEFEAAGVKVVCFLDPEDGILAVYPLDEFPRRYTADEELTLPEVFPDFRVKVRAFLE